MTQDELKFIEKFKQLKNIQMAARAIGRCKDYSSRKARSTDFRHEIKKLMSELKTNNPNEYLEQAKSIYIPGMSKRKLSLLLGMSTEYIRGKAGQSKEWDAFLLEIDKGNNNLFHEKFKFEKEPAISKVSTLTYVCKCGSLDIMGRNSSCVTCIYKQSKKVAKALKENFIYA